MNFLLRSLLLISMSANTFCYADITPVLNTIQEVSLGQVLFTQGNCTISHVNGSFSNVNPGAMCGWEGNGTPGRFTIIANPSRQIRIKILQRTNEGDGFIFIPQGELLSDTETLSITSDVAQDIDSGPSGIVNIHMGGQFFMVSPAAPNTIYELIKVNGIEWSELP